MSNIVVFGAGGRAGRRVVAEAAARGHRVTAVVREPSRHADLVGAVAGDVTNADSVARVAAGHHVAVSTVYREDVPSEQVYVAAAEALLDGLARAGVDRLLAVGIGTLLETAPGVRVHDAPDFPDDYRTLSLGHAAGLDVLRGADTDLDWVVLAPPPTLLDEDAERTGHYRLGDEAVLNTPQNTANFGYADLAVAIVDQIEQPTRHHSIVAVGY